nr:immunoglobulin heavy chain junction region [Macaca mulatta]MOY19536.1 immunoglobulin heavy chain junction region [Macaca mulatta]MOY20090.1 immunoglobulin heavy chain junction region [Macaca mulatta]MOY20984.1 immunoglobulin heavy chain junction region [Macaca mulatta]
CSRRNEEADVW